MAWAIVNIVLQKLTDPVIHETFSQYGVKDQIEFVKQELIKIWCFLKDADPKCRDDIKVYCWLKEVREVSFLIEDAIDMFLTEVWKTDEKSGPMKLALAQKLANEMNKIQGRIRDISISRNTKTYAITNLERSEESVNFVRRQTVESNNEKEMVGFESEKKEIIKLLQLDSLFSELRVVSIVGDSGLGKTTLAKKVYNSTEVNESEFDVKIYLTVSPGLEMIEIFKDVLAKLRGLSNDEVGQSKEYFISEINKLLRDKRYFIILDNYWLSDIFSDDLLPPIFPDTNNGSRVLITTCELYLATRIDSKRVYKLWFLTEDERLELLLQKATPKRDYTPDLLELAKKLTKFIAGWPQALVVLGGLLSTKPQTINAWSKVLNTINKLNQGKNMAFGVFMLCYKDLSLPVQSCFIYLSLFPEDYEIEAETLVSLWVAEGLIPDEAGKIMEDIAHSYLEELAQRCMIRVLERSSVDGRVKKFHASSILLTVALHESKEKEFFKLVTTQEHLQSISVARRVTFQPYNSITKNTSFEAEKLTEFMKPNLKLRTLFLFKEVVPFLSNFMLLRVLVVIDVSVHLDKHQTWWHALQGLLHLRCLEFIECIFSEFLLPIDSLHNLQILKLYRCTGIEVPNSLWRNKALRHVTIHGNEYKRELELTPADLPNLQTLEEVVIHEPIVDPLNMPNLHKLSLKNYSSSWEAIVALLAKLVNLVYLKLGGGSIPQEIISLLPRYQHMQTLKLVGQWAKGVELNENVDIFPPNLTELILDQSRIKWNFIPMLEKLENLKVLILDNAYNGDKIICSDGGFCQLQKLSLICLYEIEEWVIEKSALPMLKELKIVGCKRLRELPKLQHVTTLEALHVSMPKEFIKKVQKGEHHKIMHINQYTFGVY